MSARTQIALDSEMQRRAQKRAAELGVSFAEYIRRLVAQDLDEAGPAADISVIFDIIDEGPATHVARDKDKMVAEAVWGEYLGDVGRKAFRAKRQLRP